MISPTARLKYGFNFSSIPIKTAGLAPENPKYWPKLINLPLNKYFS